MNREIKTKKVGRQKKLTNPCPVIKGETEVMVGSPRCITCQWFERKLEKAGREKTKQQDCKIVEKSDLIVRIKP